jgi:hypothetical protein
MTHSSDSQNLVKMSWTPFDCSSVQQWFQMDGEVGRQFALEQIVPKPFGTLQQRVGRAVGIFGSIWVAVKKKD